MLVKMFSVYDSKAETWLSPFGLGNPKEAIRAFMTEANDPASMIGRHPADYTLFQVGTFDTTSGQIVGMVTPTNLGQAASYVRPVSPGALFPTLERGEP